MPRPWLRWWSLWRVQVRGGGSNLAAFYAPRLPCERPCQSSGTRRCRSRLKPQPIRNEGRHRLDRAAASSPSKSRPKWLRLSEGAVGTLCLLEHGRDARLLTAGKTSRSECFLGAAFALFAAGVVHINDLLAQSLMHRD